MVLKVDGIGLNRVKYRAPVSTLLIKNTVVFLTYPRTKAYTEAEGGAGGGRE